jgi:alkanesulfonate monooxygenase SsuD/methylene tetrahydromethanopterin reductase-like flavin-dependent oxidoreductase (luciferase family)
MDRTTSAWVMHPWVDEAAARIRFGIVHPLLGADLAWPDLLQRVQQAEALGFDAYWFSDHPLLNPDCWTRIAGLAATTQTIRLGTMVSCVYYRHPALLARIVADVDHMSDGRVILGLGIGDFVPEFEQLGLAFPPTPVRQQALEEAIRILRGVWGDAPFTLEGETFRVRGAHVQPPPVQQPRVPILIAGAGERVTLRQVAEFADASSSRSWPSTVRSWAGRTIRSFAPIGRRRWCWPRRCRRCRRRWPRLRRTSTGSTGSTWSSGRPRRPSRTSSA